MPSVYFMGYVEPRETLVRVQDLTPIMELDKASGFVVKFTVAIWDSIVSIECELDEFKEEYVSNLWTRSLELSRTAVNLMNLKMGWGITVHLETFIGLEGKEERLMNQGDVLKNLIDAYDLDDIDRLFNDIASNVDFFMLLDDVIGAVTTPRVLATNCARAIDAIRHLVSPGAKDKIGWEVLRERLNADENYLQFISNTSKNSRHGKHEFLSLEIAEEVLVRTWTIINRYLHYRVSAPSPLPIDNFPQLKHVHEHRS